MKKAQKYYVVWKGRKPGIFTSWKECSDSVSGFPDAEYKAFDSPLAAEDAFQKKYEDFKGGPATRGMWKTAIVKPILPSICVDAACAGVPGPLEYQGVDLETGEKLFHMGPFADGTNNVGEFLAIMHALEWMKKQKVTRPIYSDSVIAVGWVKQGICRTKMEKTPANAALFYLIGRAEKWLAENNIMAGIIKWDTENWGENPADFGRK